MATLKLGVNGNGRVGLFDYTDKVSSCYNTGKAYFHRARSAAPKRTAQNRAERRKTALISTKKNRCSSMCKPVPLFVNEYLKKRPKILQNMSSLGNAIIEK